MAKKCPNCNSRIRLEDTGRWSGGAASKSRIYKCHNCGNYFKSSD